MTQVLRRLLFVALLGITNATLNYDQDSSNRWIWKTEFKKPQTSNPTQQPGTIKVDLADFNLFSPLEYSQLKDINPNLILPKQNVDKSRTSSLTLENQESIHIPRLVFSKSDIKGKGENLNKAIEQARRRLTPSNDRQKSTTLRAFVPKKPLTQNLGTKHRGVTHIDEIFSEDRTTGGIAADINAEANLRLIHASSEAEKQHLQNPKSIKIVSLADILSGKVQSNSIRKHLSSYLAGLIDPSTKTKDSPDVDNLNVHTLTLASNQELPFHESGNDEVRSEFHPSFHLLRNLQDDEDEFIPTIPTHNEVSEQSFTFSSPVVPTLSSSKARQDLPNIPGGKLEQNTPLLHSLLKASPKVSLVNLSVQEKTAPRNSLKRTALNITPNNINQILNERKINSIHINIGEENDNIPKIETDNGNQNFIHSSNLANDVGLKWQKVQDIHKAPSPSFQTVYGTSEIAVDSMSQDEILRLNEQKRGGGSIIKANLVLPNPRERQRKRVNHLSPKNVQTKHIIKRIPSNIDLSFSAVTPSLSSARHSSLDLPLNTLPHSQKKPLKVFDAELTDVFSIPASYDGETHRSRQASTFLVSESFENASEPNELAEAFARLHREDQNRILNIMAEGRSKYLNLR